MTDNNIAAINEKVKRESSFVEAILLEVGKVIIGQRDLLERLLVGLLANGHILIEGVPGLAKTTAVKTLSETIRTKFQRLQFTPDMLPADLTGTLIYDQRTGDFSIKKGPLFANIILADEINRAPAKVQSALLEAMQERQITIGEETLKLDDPFLVLATQNPIEQEGTYPLPEAQVDRFMLKVRIGYPYKSEELKILKRMSFTSPQLHVQQVVTPADIIRARAVVDEIYMDEKIEQYIVNLVDATRNPGDYNMPELKGLIQYGASPRATINLALASKAYAFLLGRGYVTPQDIKTMGLDVLRHRVIISYEAEAEEQTSEDIIKKIFDEVEVP
ncbi:MAG TPA: MoxR family ATPase [Candidatus Omnitrophota bacterium]|nr:MoxR family ATPase [Candidatus Omnitrophota bacterium]HPB68652.1 MoxR family ATPase [Candidatus Omnitrophota bacterium]HQO58754.1 MoxR family ATPase [Candidatus Omnitrophota bacterium]HQP11733.1 MoxR family ATPase [Candidatus Omnitrophota bacterium]